MKAADEITEDQSRQVSFILLFRKLKILTSALNLDVIRC